MVLGVGSIVGFASDRARTLGGYRAARNRCDNTDRGRCPADRVGGAGGQAARARRGTPHPGHRAVRVTDRGRAHHRTNVLSVAVLSHRTERPRCADFNTQPDSRRHDLAALRRSSIVVAHVDRSSGGHRVKTISNRRVCDAGRPGDVVAGAPRGRMDRRVAPHGAHMCHANHRGRDRRVCPSRVGQIPEPLGMGFRYPPVSNSRPGPTHTTGRDTRATRWEATAKRTRGAAPARAR